MLKREVVDNAPLPEVDAWPMSEGLCGWWLMGAGRFFCPSDFPWQPVWLFGYYGDRRSPAYPRSAGSGSLPMEGRWASDGLRFGSWAFHQRVRRTEVVLGDSRCYGHQWRPARRSKLCLGQDRHEAFCLWPWRERQDKVRKMHESSRWKPEGRVFE